MYSKKMKHKLGRHENGERVSEHGASSKSKLSELRWWGHAQWRSSQTFWALIFSQTTVTEVDSKWEHETSANTKNCTDFELNTTRQVTPWKMPAKCKTNQFIRDIIVTQHLYTQMVERRVGKRWNEHSVAHRHHKTNQKQNGRRFARSGHSLNERIVIALRHQLHRCSLVRIQTLKRSD